MTKVLWRQYKEWSGCLVRGTDQIEPQDPSLHLSCAAWLTAEAEGPSYGFVQSYDGAGISAGLLHNVLVLPREMVQGDLGALTRKILDVCQLRTSELVSRFDSAMKRKGWTLAPDGKFRQLDGSLVSATELRDWAAPPNGYVPQRGAEWDRASAVATLFHELFAAYDGRKVQEDFAIAWLARGNRAAELAVYQAFTNDAGVDSAVSLPVSRLPPAVHTAMCVYHSFSVNSPKVAAECLDRARDLAGIHGVDANLGPKSLDTALSFSKKLIRELGRNGRDAWHDEPGDGNNRYDRTRVALWSEPDMFPEGRELMPRDL